MANNYGFTFSYYSPKKGKRVRRKTRVYRTKDEARLGVTSFSSFFGKGLNPRIVKASKQEFIDFKTGRV